MRQRVSVIDFDRPSVGFDGFVVTSFVLPNPATIIELLPSNPLVLIHVQSGGERREIGQV